MRIAIIGNSGSGKSTLARRYRDEHGLAVLELDTIVWEPGVTAVLRPAAAVQADLEQFLQEHQAWVVEGCYAEVIERVLPHCSELLFLNPGRETCRENNHRRPWEPHKYRSSEEQEAMSAALLEWVDGYYIRDDAWSLVAHRRLYDEFDGAKRELTELPPNL